MAASLPWLACSSSSNDPPRDGGHDGASSNANGADAGGADAACIDPLLETSTLRGVGFDAWEGLGILGCLNPSLPVDDTKCDDGTVRGGGFMVMTSVCTGDSWELYVFDGSRGLNCGTTHAPVAGVFTITPADCTCALPNRAPASGCEEADGGADGEAGP
jgi:hypothetical protein